MFNFLKKQQQQAEKNYPEIVTQIHMEFDTASERILAEAKQIIENCNVLATEKVKTLERLGFKKAQQVKETNEALRQKEKAEEIARHVVYYREKYPFNKFITEQEVEKICKKYGLVKGGVALFTGFVPEVKMKEIEGFKLRKEELGWANFSNGISFEIGKEYFIDTSHDGYWVIKNKLGTHMGYQSNDGINFYGRDQLNAWGKQKTDPLSDSFILQSGLQICAPPSQMDMTGLRVADDGYSLVKYDPIVLQGVRGGYLIVTAWGDEASDPIVVNPVNN